MKRLLFLLTIPLVLWGQIETGGLTAKASSAIDFTAATSTAPVQVGTSLPGTCTVGDFYFKSDDTAGENVHLCTASNTRTQFVDANLAYGAIESLLDGAAPEDSVHVYLIETREAAGRTEPAR